jgi:hypothetical protein
MSDPYRSDATNQRFGGRGRVRSPADILRVGLSGHFSRKSGTLSSPPLKARVQRISHRTDAFQKSAVGSIRWYEHVATIFQLDHGVCLQLFSADWPIRHGVLRPMDPVFVADYEAAHRTR